MDPSQFVEIMAQGEFMGKNLEEAFEFFDTIFESSQMWDWTHQTLSKLDHPYHRKGNMCWKGRWLKGWNDYFVSKDGCCRDEKGQ